MATVTPTVDNTRSRVAITWASMATGDTITAFELDNRPVRHATLHLYGTWGSATVTLTGSFVDSDYDIVPDAFGTDISKTDDAVVAVGAMTTYLKPTIAGGSGDDVTAVLVAWFAD